MTVKYSEIEDAFFFVSMAPRFTNTAILSKATGKIYYVSGFGDSDDLPDDVEAVDRYIEIPHKNDLELGFTLVREFVSQWLPDRSDEVERIFSRKGAYSRFKDLLDSKGLIEQWHEYENVRTESALRKWCTANGLNTVS